MITNEQIASAYPGLMYLRDAKLPNSTAFALLRFFRKYNPALEDYGKAEQKLLEEFAEKTPTGSIKVEDGKPCFENEEKLAAFEKALKELHAQDSNLEPFKKFNLSSLGNVELSPKHLMGMEWLFEDTEEQQ